ncbi:TPA: hypothetical protein I7763_04015, partial [Vibrio vulnificus]|nr:hypothetical protein [Vibrio vulnificus]
VSYLVILANAGAHGTASVVGRYYYCIVVALVLLWRVRFQTRHPVRVDKWFPVCTGMTAGGAAAVFRFFVLCR